MARRIGLAQALINDPDLLILDEPTTGLDPIGTRQIKDLIVKLAKRGKTVLLCSHLLADVEDVCDRIAILYGGKIQAKGRVSELLRQTNKRQITTDAISDNAVEKIKQIIEHENAHCHVTSPMHKLETFFIDIVTAAQRQARRSSGAVSTTKIGDFLATETVSENILDKLVGADVSEQPGAQPAQTEKVAPVEDVEPKPDEQLLGKLTESIQPKPERDDEKTAARPVETEAPRTEQIKTDILDELAGRTKPQTQDPTQTDKPQAGDSGDE